MTTSFEVALRDKIFASAFFYASIGMALVAPDGRWLAANKSLCDLVGYSEDELLSTTFQDITHPDDLNEDLVYVEKMLSGKLDSYQMEKRYIHKSGNIINILLSVSLVWDENKNPAFFISQIQDITARKHLEEELLQLAAEDYLTKVCNRRCFFESVKREIQRSERLDEVMTLLILDIDHFKRVNDKYGHDAGDSALKAIATTCKNALRAIDIFGRVGGEEFGALLVNTGAKTGRQVAERLRKHIQELPIEIDGQIINVTVSIGGVSFSGGEHPVDYRVKQADELLYEVKNEGRNASKIVSDVEDIRAEQVQAELVRLVWQDSYECGEETIDKQHQHLFRLTNQLLNALLSRAPRSICEKLVANLLNQITTHFHDEENILRLTNYPYLEDHIQMHLELATEAKKTADRFITNNLSIEELFKFLAMDVISIHMKVEDVKFFSHLNNDYQFG